MKWNLRLLPNKENAQATQELKILEEDVIAARNFIRKNQKHYFQSKRKIPLYLIMGPARFGKTTILSQAGLDLIDVNNQRLDNVTPTKYCSFWFTQDALYIDTAGTYTKPDITRPRNDIIWQGFIKLLQKHFGKNSICGTLIILDLPAITQDKNLLKKTLFCIRERIYEIATLLKNIHAHIIFTKCDRISGFTEFFSLLDNEERSQPFGISFQHSRKIDLIPDFEVKFNKLLKHLNNRVVENLQKSVRPAERALIKMFPSQMDHLRQTFIEVISKIPHSNQISLSGIYFTSSIQDGLAVDPIKATLLHILNLKEKATYSLEASNNRSYFVEHIFRNTIGIPKKSPRKRFNFSWPRMIPDRYIYPLLIAGLIIVVGSVIGYQSYYKNIAAINQANISIQTQNINDPNSLYTISAQLEKNSKSLWLTLGVNKVKSLYKSLIKSHQTLFAQNLASQIENYLSTSNNQPAVDIQKIYHGLQVYLMLGNPEKLDPACVKSWFSDYWTGIYGDGEQKNILLQQLNPVLQNKFKVDLNQTVVATARENLNNLSPIQLTYLLLENNYINQNIDINNNNSMSKMYTKDHFHKIYNNSIPDLVNNLPKYDWVLGDLKPRVKTSINNDIIKSVRELYIEQYVQAWDNVIKQEAKVEFKDLTEAAKYLNNISSQKGTMLSLLKQIKYNIDISNPPPKFTKEINIKLQNIDTINLKDLQNNLDKLAHFINTIANNPDLSSASFTTVTKYLQDRPADHSMTTFKAFANHQPPLLRSYLLTIATNTWQALFDATYDHINQAWAHIILPKYKATLDNKYPLFKDSKNDISLEDFNNFFGPHGTIDSFFNQYIEPLVNADKTNWTWKSINDQKIGFSPTFLEVFLRAALIQKMFYSSKESSPKLEFTLTPIGMTPNTQSFIMDIDGQKISFSNENKKTQSLFWPGPQSGSVTMSFVSAQGKYQTVSEVGPWAWFRVLDKANVTSGNNIRNFELTFDLNGNAVKYTLSTAEPVNPFIPEIINNFRCQEQ